VTPWKLKHGREEDDDEVGVLDEDRREPAEMKTGEDIGAGPKGRESAPRELNVTPERLDKYGWTDGCIKCDAMRRGNKARSHRSHSQRCKERVKRAMLEDELDRDKVEESEQRINEYLEKEVERSAELEEATKKRKVSVAEARNDAEKPEEPNDVEQNTSPRKGGETDMIDIEASAQPMSTSSSSGSGLKRERDHDGDEEEQTRPGRYQMTEEEGDGDKDIEMKDGTAMNMHKGHTRRFEPEDEEGLRCMIEDRGKIKEGKYSVCEVFSPPRICARARERNMRGGWSLDWVTKCPTTGMSWDLSLEKMQKKAMALLKKDKPGLIVCSPPCTLFSVLQNLTGDPKCRNPEAYDKAVKLVEFAVEMCKEQNRAGRLFAFEHPLSATSWKLPALKELMKKEGVRQTTIHQCAYGLTSHDEWGEGLVMKPTRIITNSQAIADKLQRRCDRSHRHVQLVSGRAAAAAIYPKELLDAILDGYEIERASKVFNVEDAMKKVHIDELHQEEEKGWRYIDDNTGETLDMKMVEKARAEELGTFKEMCVWVYVTREQAILELQDGGKLIGVRWVDILKGNGVRSRLVAQEFASNEDRDDLFAATPPLMATKYLLSDLASKGKQPGEFRLMVLDIKRAFLYGEISDKIYVELPDEDPKKEQGFVGRLHKAMYGTRAAPQVWQDVVRRVLQGLGFSASTKFPSVYMHKVRKMKVVTHVDDFLVTGKRGDLIWLRKCLEEEFELKGNILGPGVNESKEEKFLGRTIKWTEEGLEYHGDDKHATILVNESDMDGSKPTSTPGVPEEKKIEVSGEEEMKLDKKMAKRFRRAAARVNYMALDRVDLSFAAKDVSRGMANPSEADMIRLKRIIRYVKGRPRLTMLFKWQERPGCVRVYSDSDWAGCTKTRRSTSGGVIMHGSHCLHHWSSTQVTVAASSGEAELNALNKAVAECIAIIDLMNDCDEKCNGTVYTDSSAANGIAHRRGCGKIKHLETRQLWL